MFIHNPFVDDVTNRLAPVDPVDYYKDAFLDSVWCKKQFELSKDQMEV